MAEKKNNYSVNKKNIEGAEKIESIVDSANGNKILAKKDEVSSELFFNGTKKITFDSRGKSSSKAL